MRARDFLCEANNLSYLKTQIIGQVKKTNDSDLLQKIYTVLNKTGLVDRIGLVLDRDTDTKGYVKQLTDMIIDVPGTYDEKTAFVKGYPKGYIDIDKMLSGEYVRFKDLIAGDKDAPIEFIHRVFDSLKQVSFGGAKGPGEFGLAVLSPFIKITGKGDLNIGNITVEVKAAVGKSGGRVGTPGLLSSDNIPNIIGKYIEFDSTASLNLKQLSSLLDTAKLDSSSKKKLAKELFTYIFKGKADVSEIVDAVVNNQDPNPAYLKANYELYRAESKFDGMMLINFPAQALKYYIDPAVMASELYSFDVYLISANQGFQTRQILSQVTLKPVKEPTQATSSARAKKTKTANEPAQNTEPNTVQQPQERIVKKLVNAYKGYAKEVYSDQPEMYQQVVNQIDADIASGKVMNDSQAWQRSLVKKFPKLRQ
jgi:hypothetical protein